MEIDRVYVFLALIVGICLITMLLAQKDAFVGLCSVRCNESGRVVTEVSSYSCTCDFNHSRQPVKGDVLNVSFYRNITSYCDGDQGCIIK